MLAYSFIFFVTAPLIALSDTIPKKNLTVEIETKFDNTRLTVNQMIEDFVECHFSNKIYKQTADNVIIDPCIKDNNFAAYKLKIAVKNPLGLVNLPWNKVRVIHDDFKRIRVIELQSIEDQKTTTPDSYSIENRTTTFISKITLYWSANGQCTLKEQIKSHVFGNLSTHDNCQDPITHRHYFDHGWLSVYPPIIAPCDEYLTWIK
jgi:hypothetical protein